MDSLPSDIVQDIVSRVPAETVLECKLVCKRWVTLIRSTNFANMHLKHQLKLIHGAEDDGDDNLATNVELCLFFACRVDDPNVVRTLLFLGGKPSGGISIDDRYIYSQKLRKIYHPPMHHQRLYNHLVGSCNGLVCAFQQHGKILDPIYVCNPLTREYVYLPKLVVKKKDNDYLRVACGFGYVRSTNEFKGVRVHYPKDKDNEGNVEVYTLGSGYGWRAVGRVSYRLMTWGAGTYVDDAIYWIAGNEVVAFYLADEKFQLLSAPPCMQNFQCGDGCGLVVLGRHLCLYMATSRVEIWALMKSSDSKDTWRMEFDIDLSEIEFEIDYGPVVGSRGRNFRPVLLTNNGEIVFLCESCVLYFYDTKTRYLRMISDEASADFFESVEAIAHVNTFASLKAMGENSKTYTVRTPSDDVIDDLGRVAIGDTVDTTPFSPESSAL